MLTLTVQLLGGQYEAASSDRAVAEWPPHPARAFCALVASAKSTDEWDALRWLEQQQPPTVVAAREVTATTRSGWVVTNRRDAKGGSQFHPGRSNAFRSRASITPTSDRIVFVWPESTAGPDLLAALDGLALRMPYLGRSSGHVLAQFSDTETGEDRLSRFVPCRLSDAETMVRVPYIGYVDALREAFDIGLGATAADRAIGYRVDDGDESDPPAHRSQFADFVVLEFTGFLPDGGLAPRFTSALRRAVLDRVADPAPAALHGHGLPDQPHVAFLPLVQAGHPHARGRLSGLALAVPRLDPAERAKIGRALIDPHQPERPWELNVPGIGGVEVRYTGHPRLQSLLPSYWQRHSSAWVSATPVAYDRYPKSDAGWYDEIRRSCVVAGYPEPDLIEISSQGLTPGAISLDKRELPGWLSRRVLRHVRLQFPMPVAGPLILGAGRYLGVGIFVPEHASREPAAVSPEKSGTREGPA